MGWGWGGDGRSFTYVNVDGGQRWRMLGERRWSWLSALGSEGIITSEGEGRGEEGGGGLPIQRTDHKQIMRDGRAGMGRHGMPPAPQRPPPPPHFNSTRSIQRTLPHNGPLSSVARVGICVQRIPAGSLKHTSPDERNTQK